jgi:hypothetical protein
VNVESKVPYGLVFETKQEREGASADPNYWQANDAANAAIQVLFLLALLCKQNDAGFQALTLRALPEQTHKTLPLRAAPHDRATTLTMRRR